ncbi:squamosa promoter-binding-like protein 1 isoform X1 [Cynara cardunculus var. scolymus]|uniref:squamosa promoter-binding-like protein 1 isoform X1 n=2 Tax=Cynara cardunculus var. scolymus TaxID=59895 RepID=UPI000D6265AD|nr:squamosa promoter-binding-like protein 1 isoform X1 [Cynara cardunculus var. scolymus]
MEAKFGGNPHHYYGPVVSDLKAVGKTSMEWDLNDWKWDGDLFAATPLNAISSDCRSRQLFPVTSGADANTGVSNSSSSCSDEGKRELEKRRRVVVLDEEEQVGDEVGALNLNLGGQMYSWEGKSGKKSKVGGATPNRAVCQVDDCQTDLTGAKDYHRRHKVCNLHSKSTKALVGNVMQRFCQQCSRFHALQEFDEGKRSCRRRLAGHNRRRRKTHPENTINGVSLNDERSCSYLLVSLLRILSNVQSNTSEQSKDQDLLSHLLKNLASLAGTVNDKNSSGLLSGSQCLQDAGTSSAPPEKEPLQPVGETVNPSRLDMMHRGVLGTPDPCQITISSNNKAPTEANTVEATVGKMKLNNIDLNMVYDDSQDCMEPTESFETPENTDNVPIWLRRHPHKSSPPQTSGNSGSTATQSPSSSSGEAQSRTDRIVFKLFGKDPNELPIVLRNQILDWLLHSPTDIEGYIRPGCIILAIYLRMDNSSWDELCYDLSSHLRKLLDASSNSFWRTGWVYTRVLDHVAFVCDGQIVLNTALPHKSHRKSSILNITPIAVSASESTQFSVKGFNISWSTSRMLCVLEGSYLLQTSCSDLMEAADSLIKHEDTQSLSFSCPIPHISGRGFIEIEDDSLSSSFFPFIVAEQDVCSEIRTLESDLDVVETSDDTEREKKEIEARTRALEFVNEMGWLLHRSQLKVRLGSMDPSSDSFSFKRFRWLIEFSIDHDWCAVVKKLLGIILNGAVETAEHGSVEVALVEVGLLHRAVRRNSNRMVSLLLNYHPENVSGSVLFRPDAAGPGGLTPLHIASGKDGSESVLDALTDDPLLVGLDAWRNSRDSSGLSPYDYASLRGHYNYIHLVQRKMNKKRSEKGHVVVDMPPTESPLFKVAAGFETEKGVVVTRAISSCSRCERKVAYYGGGRSSLAIYKPAMLSMVAIAAVCVCVALLFKSSPQVMYVFQPFIWERLKYGAS